MTTSGIETKSLPMRQKIIEKEIRKTVYKPKGKLTKADMAKVRYLNIDWSKYEISDWNLISELTKLEGLTMGQSVDDLMPLSGLKNLSFLSLQLCLVENLEPLANLSKLRCLSLVQSTIKDLSPLARLSELEMLRLDWNDLYDIRPLSGLENLKFLSLGDTLVDDLSPLIGLKQLKVIYLKDYDHYPSEEGIGSVSESDINNFQKSLPGCHIAHDYRSCHDA